MTTGRRTDFLRRTPKRLHDVVEMLRKLLLPLLTRETHYKVTAPEDWDSVKDIHYTVGRIRHATVFGQVELGCGRCFGQRERVRLPVSCKYIF